MTEHIIRTASIVVLTIAAGIGAALTEGDVRVAMLGALAILVPAAIDSLRVARRGSGGGGSAVLIVLLSMGLAGCGGGVAAVAGASDQVEERLCARAPEGAAREACFGCVRETTDAIICEMDEEACHELAQ